MKELIMTKHEDILMDSFIYRVLDNEGNTIASRMSNRNYIACYIVPNKKGPAVDRRILPYRICNCFSRKDLIGKGDSAKIKPYAIAYLKEPDNIL